jgi:hypothetical protein
VNRKQRRAQDAIARKSSISDELEGRLHRIENAIGQMQTQVNQALNVIHTSLRTLNPEVGDLYDICEAIISTEVSNPVSLDLFNKYLSEDLGLTPDDLDMPAKLDALVQYLDLTMNFNVQKYQQFKVMAFDRRHNIRPVDQGENPDTAILTWHLKVDGKAIAGQTKPALYRLGSNDLLVDDKILSSKPGELVEVDIDYPQDHHVEELRGVKGVLGFTLYSLRIRKDAPPPILSEEEKKQRWKEGFQAETIE